VVQSVGYTGTLQNFKSANVVYKGTRL